MKPGVSLHRPESLSDLMEMTQRIALDPDLIRSLEDPNFSSRMINAILHGGYFSEEEGGKLRSLLGTLYISFRYQDRIIEEIGRELRLDHSSEMEDPSFRKIQVRDPAFRRSVLEAYDERCAVCGIRLIAYSGYLSTMRHISYPFPGSSTMTSGMVSASARTITGSSIGF